MDLAGAHRTTRDKTAKGGAYYIHWKAWRGKGAPNIGSYSAPTKAEAIAIERKESNVVDRARKYGEARQSHVSANDVAGLLDLYEQTHDFKKCSESTKAERSRLIKQIRDDDIPPEPGKPDAKLKLGTLPTRALSAPRTVGYLTRWRDAEATLRGPRAADSRVQLLRRALSVMHKQGLAPANPALGLGDVYASDRSDMIWEEGRDDAHVERYLAHVRKEIDRVWAEPATKKVAGRVVLNRVRFARIMALAAARDALLLVINNGMRREDLAVLKWPEVTELAFVYTARKGERRARTAGRKRGVTIVPILREARLVLIRRREAHGQASPWVIVSSRGGNYTPNALGELVNETARTLELDRHLHDGKGTFVTRLKRDAPWLSNAEIGEMVDWSEDDVDRIIRRYVSTDEIARAKIARLQRRNG